MRLRQFLVFFILLFTITMTIGCSNPPVYSSITPRAEETFPIELTITMGGEQAQDPTSTPFLKPINTEIITATQTRIPESSIDPFNQYSTPTNNQKTITPTSTPSYPLAKIQIQSPGAYSKVTSPINLISYVQPGFDRKVYIELIGENGETLYQDFRVYQDLPRLWAPVLINLPFTFNGVLEYGRLQIYTIDQFQRLISLNSVNIFLQSDGLNRIYLNNLIQENIIVTSPVPMDSIHGGLLRIEGKFQPINHQPIRIDLITNSGSIVASKTIEQLPENYDNVFSLNTEIAYQVNMPTPIRLTFSQLDARLPGYVYIFSQEIILNP